MKWHKTTNTKQIKTRQTNTCGDAVQAPSLMWCKRRHLCGASGVTYMVQYSGASDKFAVHISGCISLGGQTDDIVYVVNDAET